MAWKRLTSWILANLEALCVGELPSWNSLVTAPPAIPNNNTCTSDICVDLAGQLVKQTTFNTTEIDLCNDFEKFVCDGWRAEHELRPDQGSVIYHNILQDRSTDIIHGYLEGSESPVDGFADKKLTTLVKQAYQACMNENEIKKQGANPLTEMLVEITKVLKVDESLYISPGSRYVAEEDPDSMEIVKILLHLQSTGTPHVLDIGVTRDNKDPSSRIIHIAPPSQLTLAKDYYQDPDVMADYSSIMPKVLSALHPIPQARRNVQELVKLVVDLETRMAALLPPLSDLHDVNKFYNLLSLSDTAKLAPFLGLDQIITGMLSQHRPAADMDHYDPHKHKIMTSFPDTIREISDVFRNTSKEVIQTYLLWRVIGSLEEHAVIAPEMEPLRAFLDVLGGRDPKTPPERWRSCTSYVSRIDTLGWIPARFYSSHHFSPRDKELGEQLVDYITAQYQDTMRNGVPWLEDPNVRSVAIQKLANLQALVGSPSSPDAKPIDLTNASSVLSFYSDLLTPSSGAAPPIGENHFANIQRLKSRAIARSWSRLSRPSDARKSEWLMTPQTVNAYNDIGSGVIALPAALLQPPFFGADLPSYVNFGITGWTIGHEVSHSFDMSGRKYDLEGRFGGDWWTAETDAAFRQRAECFVEQYGNYSVVSDDEQDEGKERGGALYQNGRLTLGENIADAGGIDTAFLAWQAHRARHPEQDTDLPGLSVAEGGKWTHEQLFFVAFASLWCSKSKRELLVSQVFDDPHSRPKVRVKGTLANSKWFREVFRCESKEPVCKIW